MNRTINPWVCKSCGTHNSEWRMFCKKCGVFYGKKVMNE